MKQQLKALSLSHEPPAYVSDTDCNAIMLSFGLPLSKLSTLAVEWDGRKVTKAESFFSKTTAAHRGAIGARARARRGATPRAGLSGGFDGSLTRAPACRAAPRTTPASCRTSRRSRGPATTR